MTGFYIKCNTRGLMGWSLHLDLICEEAATRGVL